MGYVAEFAVDRGQEDFAFPPIQRKSTFLPSSKTITPLHFHTNAASKRKLDNRPTEKAAARDSSRLEHIVDAVADVQPLLLHSTSPKRATSKYVAYSEKKSG